MWRFGDQIVDTARAAELWRQGHDVIFVEYDIKDTDEVRGRSRSPVHLACVGTIDGGHEGTRWGRNENKKQRLE